jgi:hypothetical protein
VPLISGRFAPPCLLLSANQLPRRAETAKLGLVRSTKHLPARNVTGRLLAFQKMPIRYREVLEYMQGYLAAYPLGFEADETGQRNIVADRNGYRLGESVDLEVIGEMVKGENEAFTNNMQRKTFRQLMAMFAADKSSS